MNQFYYAIFIDFFEFLSSFQILEWKKEIQNCEIKFSFQPDQFTQINVRMKRVVCHYKDPTVKIWTALTKISRSFLWRLFCFQCNFERVKRACREFIKKCFCVEAKNCKLRKFIFYCNLQKKTEYFAFSLFLTVEWSLFRPLNMGNNWLREWLRSCLLFCKQI